MPATYTELAIGLALAFLLLSLLVSGINEGLSRLMGIRSKFLWAYLRDMIEGQPAGTEKSRLPSSVADILLRVPTNKMPGGDPRPEYKAPPPPATPSQKKGAAGLYERLQEIDRGLRGRSSISQIPANRFAAAVIEIATAGPAGTAERQAGTAEQAGTAGQAGTAEQARTAEQPGTAGQAGTADHAATVVSWLAGLERSGSPLCTPLNSVWAAASGDIDRFRTGVESWFDGEMRRLSLLYRRNVRWIITVLAVLVTLFAGLDALQYSQALISDQAFRTQVVAVASGNPSQLSNLSATCQTLEDQQQAAHASTSSGPYQCISTVLSNPALTLILADPLLGVHLSARGSPVFTSDVNAWWNRVRSPGHWPGFVITVVALLFGAPFWWDILRRLTGVRSRASSASSASS
jgi:hypothetical protein